MPFKKYAFCHPGKIGDALYSLPTIHTVCEKDGAIADFHTSEACLPLKRLILYQEHINSFVIPLEYKIYDYGQGVQPWKMPVRENMYDKVFQLGFKNVPNGPIHRFIAREAGISEKIPDPHYTYPDITFYEEPYMVVAFNFYRGGSLYNTYKYIIENSPIKVVQTGLSVDWVDAPSENQMDIDLLEVLSLLSKAKIFVGFYSGLLALANGFPKLIRFITLPHAGVGEQHGLHLHNTTDLQNPDPEHLLNLIIDAAGRA